MQAAARLADLAGADPGDQRKLYSTAESLALATLLEAKVKAGSGCALTVSPSYFDISGVQDLLYQSRYVSGKAFLVCYSGGHGT